MLLPMLSIYQEYVRNHHYSLQVLTECKQTSSFAALLSRLENKNACHGRSLETFLTYPMHQVMKIFAKYKFENMINVGILTKIRTESVSYCVLNRDTLYSRHTFSQMNVSIINENVYNSSRVHQLIIEI